jgi:hypothetical protein
MRLELVVHFKEAILKYRQLPKDVSENHFEEIEAKFSFRGGNSVQQQAA